MRWEQIIYQLATFFAMTRTIDTKLGPGIPIPRLRSNPVAVNLDQPTVKGAMAENDQSPLTSTRSPICCVAEPGVQ